MTNSNYTKRVNKHSGQSHKASKAAVPSGKLSIEDVIKLLPFRDRTIYNNFKELENYQGSPESEFDGMSEKEALDKIVKKGLELGLDPSLKKIFREGSDIYKNWEKRRMKNSPGSEYASVNSAGIEIKNPDVKLEDYVHPLAKENLEGLKEVGAVYMALNSAKTSLIISHPEYRAIFKRYLIWPFEASFFIVIDWVPPTLYHSVICNQVQN